MARFSIRLLVSVLAFGLGLLAHTARRAFEQSCFSNPVIEPVRLPSESFVGTGDIDMFMEDYRRESDGAYLLFGCSDRASAADALILVRSRRSGPGERRDVLDVSGSKIGERVILGEPFTRATITWNESARLFYIDAPSIADAIAFENSKVWVGRGCWDLSPFPIPTPPPKKRLQRTRYQ